VNVPRLAPWVVAMVAALQITPADAQGNIDAGKTPAQIFGDTCSGCHRSAREFRRVSSSFLRTHYTTGADEANAMANYLSGVGYDPRAAQPKRPPADAGKQPPPQPAVRQPPEQAKSAQQSKGRPGATAQARPVVVEERPPEPPPPPAPPTPVLEPFEE